MYFSFQGKSINSKPKVNKSLEKIIHLKRENIERERGAGGCGGENDKRERWRGWRRKGSPRKEVKSRSVEEEEEMSRASQKRAFYAYVRFTLRAKHN